MLGDPGSRLIARVMSTRSISRWPTHVQCIMCVFMSARRICTHWDVQRRMPQYTTITANETMGMMKQHPNSSTVLFMPLACSPARGGWTRCHITFGGCHPQQHSARKPNSLSIFNRAAVMRVIQQACDEVATMFRMSWIWLDDIVGHD